MSYVSDLAAGIWVWCDFVNQEARTADGFCQFCGSTGHTPMSFDEFEAPESDPAEADPAEAEEAMTSLTCPLHGAGCEAWA